MAYRIEQTGVELQGILNDAAVTKQGLENEVARAQAAEGVLQENIDSEAGARQGADALLAGNIGTEVARAQQAESDLGARVDANAAGVAAEVARAQEAEGQVWDTLNDEILTRQSQDAALQGNIEREAGLREAGDGQLQGEIDAISGKIPAEASDMNQLADKQYVQEAMSDVPTREEIEDMIDTLSRNEVVVGALPQTGEEGVIYRVPGNGYYTDYMYYDGEFVELSQYSMEFDQTQVGYFTCDTAAGTAAKTVSAAGYTLAVGGNMRVKMTNANTAANATLNINSRGAKALYYNGEQASATNSWEAGEVLEVYYDGTQYQCASGGVGKFATGQNVKDTSITNTVAENNQSLITSGGVAEEIYTSQTLGYDYTDFTWKNNYRLVNGEESYAQYYVCTTNYAPCSMIITYTKGSRNYNFHFALYDKDKVWISNLNDPWGDIPANAAYFKIYTDNLWGGGVINDGMTISTYSYTSIKNTVDELKEYIEGVDYVENVVYDVNDFTWESGTITNGSDAADNYSSRSVGYTPLNPIYFVLTKGNKQISNYGCSFYDSDKVFLSSASNPTSAPAKAAFFRLTVKHWGTPQNVINDNFFVNTKKVWDLIEYVPEMAARIDRNKGNADFALISKFRYIITSFGYGQEMLILFGSNNMVDWSYISMPYYPISNGATMVRDPSIIQIGKWYYIIYSYSATSQSMTTDLRMGVTRTENFTDFEDLPNLTAVDVNGDPFVGTESGSWAPAWCKIGQTIYICVSVDKQLTIYEYHPSTHTITYIAQPVIGSFTWTIDSHLYKYNNYYYLIGLGSNSRAYIAKSAAIDGTYTVVSTNLNTQSEGEKCIMLDDGRWLMIMQASWKEGKPMMYSICSDGFEGEWSTPQDITIDDAYIASLIPSHADVMDRIHFGTGYDL